MGIRKSPVARYLPGSLGVDINVVEARVSWGGNGFVIVHVIRLGSEGEISVGAVV